MYQCHIRFYFAGRQPEIYNTIKEMKPSECFSYEFSQSDTPDAALAANADIFFAEVCDEESARGLRELTSYRKPVIVLADKQSAALLSDQLEDIEDIWTLPMSREETEFRFSRLQRLCKKYG
ncbi:MAG: hybrid sensor histidine kinase/response regulator, partial [Oscillospiraceae bacterium]|nr:hybrid sensor histidine kinase/response regulator [Oscillospiraceae bacterium]